jgi:hypothetical protein
MGFRKQDGIKSQTNDRRDEGLKYLKVFALPVRFDSPLRPDIYSNRLPRDWTE